MTARTDATAAAGPETQPTFHPDDWEKKIHEYERSMSVGKAAWPRIRKVARELLGVGADEPQRHRGTEKNKKAAASLAPGER